jgi:predicted phosphodiesterase
MLDRIAVISDVHGNVTALRAVLADIDTRGITRIVNLGDVIGKGPRGSEAVKLSQERCEVTVRGNWDAFIARAAVHPLESTQWARDELTAADLSWLAALPGTFEVVLSGHRIRLFHASQAGEFVRVLPRHGRDEFRGMFTNTEFTGAFLAGGVADHPPDATPDVVGYGDIHAAYLTAADGLMLFNTGSVGNHTDAPSASYVILDGVTGSLAPAPFSVTFARVSYDIAAEIAIARQLGLPDVDAYAGELLDGVYRGPRPTS